MEEFYFLYMKKEKLKLGISEWMKPQTTGQAIIHRRRKERPCSAPTNAQAPQVYWPLLSKFNLENPVIPY